MARTPVASALMFALIWRQALYAALRRFWAQRSSAWLGMAVALVLLRRFDATSRRRQHQRS